MKLLIFGGIILNTIIPEKELNNLADRLLQVYESRSPIDFYSNEIYLDEEAAYSLQNKLIQKKCELSNEKVCGYKVSMTSPETQSLFDTNEPAYGTLTTSSILYDSSTISLESMFEPLLEPELMIILKEDLSVGATEEEVFNKCEIAAGIEIPDSRFKKCFPNFKLMDLISDNGVTGKVVISDKSKYTGDFEGLENIKMELYYNGKKIKEGVSSVVMGNPLSSVVWLSNKLGKYNKYLKKGMMISSGTFINPIPIKQGRYKAFFQGVGSIEVYFSN